MPLFTFYPCLPDGSSTAFETIECADEARAVERARRVLAEHPSAVQVEVWRGERRVGAVAGVTDAA